MEVVVAVVAMVVAAIVWAPTICGSGDDGDGRLEAVMAMAI